MKYVLLSLICGFLGLYLGQFSGDEFIMQLMANFGLVSPGVYLLSKLSNSNSQ